MTLRKREGNTRVESHAGHFMRRYLPGERPKPTIIRKARRTNGRGRTPAPEESAKEAGLRYTNDGRPGIRRVRRGSSFAYLNPEGRPLRDRAELQRIKALVIPPAWTDLWICPDPRGHLQASGRDARGRKQYRYH